jgi:hypothetical protein
MLDLTTLELIPRELFVSKALALPDCMIIGCNTAGAGVLQFYPVRLGIGKNSAGAPMHDVPEVQGLQRVTCEDCQVW